MSHNHHIQHAISRFLNTPKNFRKEQDAKGNFMGFSPFDTSQLQLAQQLSDKYFRISQENTGNDPVGAVFAQAQEDAQNYDPELIRYALMIWIVHDPEARRRNIKIPPLGARAPHIVTPKLNHQATTGQKVLQTTDPKDLGWWREDPNLNEHHEHWHLVFPAFAVNGKTKDREGENFAYMHRQMLARYDIERISLGLQLVKPFDNYSESIPESYDPNPNLSSNPDDDPSTADIPFTARASGKQLSDLGGNNTVKQLLAYRQQLYDRIDGRGSNPFGTDDKSATIVGNTLETTLHNLGHMLIAYIMNPSQANSPSVSPGVMIEPRTAVRDPVFFRWHREVDNVYSRWENRQSPHDFHADAPPVIIKQDGVILAFKDKLLEADSKGSSDDWLNYAKKTFGFDANLSNNPVITNELQTEMKTRNFVWVEDDKSETKLTYLYPREFYYFFRVENTTNSRVDITLRVFLVPEVLKDSRIHWIELDKISRTLQPHEKAVFSQPCDESVVIRKPAQKTPQEMDDSAITPSERDQVSTQSADQQSDTFFCDCGWPYNLLLPRGTREGLKCKLLVFITDGAKDAVKKTNIKCGSLSFCGARWGEPYPDARRMGYPFDKPFKNNSFDATFAGLQNVAIRDVNVKWVDNFPDVSTVA
ncbi:7699_t:CDS:2 [Acaulospora morrowiae]|uniref:7699_t:CDS:1 n=1 Tax=Acaulospora morrowiae TaxID=94023 RepID=A0A9N8VF76_9GLOM|nr:7699_t:CDS:2 [Acaulospora morrowiae]